MKVLVTGGSGFIGKYVLNELIKSNIDFVTIGRNERDYTHKYLRMDLLECTDFSSIIKDIKPTHLIHLAWHTKHGEYWDSALNYDWMNVTQRLLESFCQNGGKHVLITGTCAEYDWRYGYCLEDFTPTNSNSIYGNIKNETRIISQKICKEHNVNLTWARLFYPYGLGETSERLIPSLFDVCNGKKEVFGVNIKAYRDLVHVSDVANAIVLCSKKNINNIINISSGEPTCLGSLVKLIAKICKYDANNFLSIKSIKMGEPKFLIGDSERLHKVGWQKMIDIDYGISTYTRGIL